MLYKTIEVSRLKTVLIDIQVLSDEPNKESVVNADKVRISSSYFQSLE